MPGKQLNLSLLKLGKKTHSNKKRYNISKISTLALYSMLVLHTAYYCLEDYFYFFRCTAVYFSFFFILYSLNSNYCDANTIIIYSVGLDSRQQSILFMWEHFIIFMRNAQGLNLVAKVTDSHRLSSNSKKCVLLLYA